MEISSEAKKQVKTREREEEDYLKERVLSNSLMGKEEAPFSALQTVPVHFLKILRFECINLVLKEGGCSIVKSSP